jgi:AcrR family transcriptional regulator
MLSLRERNKQRTRDAIQREGLRLISAQGYGATTCERIAEAAGVSPATLFRYFPTKEDIILQDVYDPMIAEAVRVRPAEESSLVAVRRALAETLAEVYEADLEAIRRRTALILSVPELLARSREQQQSLQEHLAGALAERTGAGHDDVSVEVMAAAFAAGLSTAVERWARLGGDLPGHVDEALAALGALSSEASR